MSVEYPKCIYREDGTFIIVESKEQHDQFRDYFPSEEPFKVSIEINIQEAKNMLSEVQEEVSKGTRRKKTLSASKDQIDIINEASDGNHDR